MLPVKSTCHGDLQILLPRLLVFRDHLGQFCSLLTPSTPETQDVKKRRRKHLIEGLWPFLEARASHGPGLSVTRSVCLSVCHTLADLCFI